jgi:hypothetical protein
MPLGIVSEEEFAEELSKTVVNNGVAERAQIRNITPNGNISHNGRNGANEVPESLRKIISEEALNGTTARELATTFKVSESSVAAYKVGKTSLYREPDKNLKSFTDSVRDRIVTRANKKILVAMNELTTEKIAEGSAREISSVMKDLSAVVKNLEPQVERQEGPIVQFTYYAPPMRQENDFATVDVIDV